MWLKKIKTSKYNCFSKRGGRNDYLNLALFKGGCIPMKHMAKLNWKQNSVQDWGNAASIPLKDTQSEKAP